MSSAENYPLKARARNEFKRRYFHRGYLWPWILVLLIPFVLRFVMFCDVTFPFPSTPSTSEVVRPEELQWYKFSEGSPDNVDIPIIHDSPVIRPDKGARITYDDRIDSANHRMKNGPSQGRTKNERSTRHHRPVTKRPDDHDTVELNLGFPEENEEDSVKAVLDEVHLGHTGKRIQAIRRLDHLNTRKAAEKRRASEEQFGPPNAGLQEIPRSRAASQEIKDVREGDEKAAEERRAAKKIKVNGERWVADRLEAAEERRDVEEREAAEELMAPKEREAEENTSAGQEKETEQGKETELETTEDEEREAGGLKNGDGNESRNDVEKNQDAKQTHVEEKNSSEVEVQKTTNDQKEDERTVRLGNSTEEGKHTEYQENGPEEKDKEQVEDSDLKHRADLTGPIDHTQEASVAAGQCDVFEEACLGLPEDNEKIDSIAVVMAEKHEKQQEKKQEKHDDKQDEKPMEKKEWTSEEQTREDDRQEAHQEEVAAEEESEQQKELEEPRDVEAIEEKREEEELKDAEGIEREMIEEQQNRIAEQEAEPENGGSFIEEVTGQTQGEQPVEAKSSGECDLFDGDWVWDPEGPLYTNSTCFYMQLAQNCMSNGRPDTDYLHWKWKPRDCDFPRFDARTFLEAFRGRTIGFVGDSLARNQMQSLLCMLSQIEIPKLIYQSHDDSSVRWLFEQHQVILASVWSPYLLRESDEGIMGFEKGQSVLYLDELDTAWTSVMKDLDIIVLSIGQWYFKPTIYVNHEEVVGCHYCPGFNLTQMRYQEAYQGAVRQVLEKVALEFEGIAIMSTFAISHFEEGLWNNGGQCRREKPLDKEEAAKFPGVHNDMYDIVMSEFNSIASDKSNLNENVKLEFLDVTKVSLTRADGHPGPYRHPNPFDGKDSNESVPNDCLHWCLPGPVDTWNQLLVKIVHRHL